MTTTHTTTRTIAGHAITLTAGLRYLASRPMAERGRTEYPVAIRELTGDGIGLRSTPVVTIGGLGYDAANELLCAFNDGESSFEGRLWE